MNFTETPLPGAFVVALAPIADERGSFARTYCRRTFAAHGIDLPVAQCNRSHNARRRTLRGMHFQRAPYEEAKLVRCSRGALWDVIIDLRQDSPTRGRWFGVELSERNDTSLYVPAGFAHGFQTLADDTVVEYTMSAFYEPGAASGVRWNDPAFGITWPVADPILSDRDRRYEDWCP
ncbi:dTDP-4-dehydrorhamnose 3,5-epimerase [Limobrevibacterium gyesilva]|uniref:dTDP-4-dehydrorhamnose 3,5-epimerase n=1 Tax=Limobrevibacterium gyesilva TaxID=2991712 RepID=A0AA42CES8_9PROT|nr:dTDP-4-dehydrorhamnose 3,5-epimerase [Limobrevibacterium gyesilva]MCW3473926.1 dTDP-4-dehydrorhamnose 3,5-epimerase [Limobrevibacterium gyesilva]